MSFQLPPPAQKELDSLLLLLRDSGSIYGTSILESRLYQLLVDFSNTARDLATQEQLLVALQLRYDRLKQVHAEVLQATGAEVFEKELRRVPLADSTIFAGYHGCPTFENPEAAFLAGARFAEEQHGITFAGARAAQLAKGSNT